MASEEGLECPVCWEGFNDADNTPYVLWCGHSLCKNCVTGLQWAVIKLPGFALQLPLFIACPWCQFLTFRISWKDCLKYPCKNFFLLWIVESNKGDNVRQRPQSPCDFGETIRSTVDLRFNVRPRYVHTQQRRRFSRSFIELLHGGWNLANFQNWLARIVAFVLHFTSKFPLIMAFFFILFYVLPFSIVVLTVYAFITITLAIPSFLVLYFCYPGLDWLAREIFT